jgi:hypothetical protein
MNKKIKELAIKAGFLQFNSGDFSEQNAVEKFAKLIVLECEKQIQQQVSLKYKDGDESQNEEWIYGHYAGSVLSRVVIKQNLGIK